MTMVLRFGAKALMGRAVCGQLEGVLVHKEVLDVEGILVGTYGPDRPFYPLGRVKSSDQDNVRLVPEGDTQPLKFTGPDKDVVVLDGSTRVFGTDGWVSALWAVEIDEQASSVSRFVFDMGHPLTRLIAVERWFVKQIQAREVSLKLTVQELKEYPPFLTRI